MTHSAPTFLIQRDRPEPEELARLIRECSIIPGECKSYFRLESQRGIGTIRYSTLCNGYEVKFYGGKLSVSNRNSSGGAIYGYVRSGKNNIKFYWAGTEGVWDSGHYYGGAYNVQSSPPYAKAE